MASGCILYNSPPPTKSCHALIVIFFIVSLKQLNDDKHFTVIDKAVIKTEGNFKEYR